MTLDQLRIFLVVAEQLHFTRAAEILYMTQSSVSAAVQNLEESYGIKLFSRVGRRIEITEAGRLLYHEAQKILEQVDLTERGLQELNNLQRGELKLGSSLTIGNYWLPQKISLFKQRYPRIDISCTLANTAEIIAGTAHGLFDMSFIEGEVDEKSKNCLQQEVVGGDHLRLLVGQPHPWFVVDSVPVSALLTTSWVMREQGSGTRAIFERTLKAWGINPDELNIILEMNSGEMVKAVVESGVGATVLSELMVKKELQVQSLAAIAIHNSATESLSICRSFKLLRSLCRFQTKASQVFRLMLVESSGLLEQ
ncbi:LysR substrate-binding domain-containing protein [Synechocystis sp. LKSZ1]|uniref:LysR substrate-binding domain-containing protein n=1 Tax=Synechocystis sp. LKSZ1 TaxID=3144951 RepID=UPI00336C2D3C